MRHAVELDFAEDALELARLDAAEEVVEEELLHLVRVFRHVAAVDLANFFLRKQRLRLAFLLAECVGLFPALSVPVVDVQNAQVERVPRVHVLEVGHFRDVRESLAAVYAFHCVLVNLASVSAGQFGFLLGACAHGEVLLAL